MSGSFAEIIEAARALPNAEEIELDDGYDFEDSTGTIVGLDAGRYLIIPIQTTNQRFPFDEPPLDLSVREA